MISFPTKNCKRKRRLILPEVEETRVDFIFQCTFFVLTLAIRKYWFAKIQRNLYIVCQYTINRIQFQFLGSYDCIDSDFRFLLLCTL